MISKCWPQLDRLRRMHGWREGRVHVRHVDGHRDVLAVGSSSLTNLIRLHADNGHHLASKARLDVVRDVIGRRRPPDTRVRRRDGSVVAARSVGG